MSTRYLFHTVAAEPRQWRGVADALAVAAASELGPFGGHLFGIWRSQIGRPRDELTVITFWPDDGEAAGQSAAAETWLARRDGVRSFESRAMMATLRPDAPHPPDRQGNYAFRSFVTPPENYNEFLALCEAAWPGFEAAYDSQVIGLWRFDAPSEAHGIETLLITRRPDLAMWERSKLPADAAEREVRAKLSRRYDLCDATWVVTTTLLTARDQVDEARWA